MAEKMITCNWRTKNFCCPRLYEAAAKVQMSDQ